MHLNTHALKIVFCSQEIILFRHVVKELDLSLAIPSADVTALLQVCPRGPASFIDVRYCKMLAKQVCFRYNHNQNNIISCMSPVSSLCAAGDLTSRGDDRASVVKPSLTARAKCGAISLGIRSWLDAIKLRGSFREK